MAEIETLGILEEIQSLVSDKLQVVSYKWLSQNFLVSSNAAKRLLQEFVEKHGNGVEVVYSLSGWLKNNPSAYHVQLVSSPKLAEAKQEFNGNCSVQVYSVQACIPKDPAALWNAEFVQAEELFKQTPIDNCFWDNRFCGVSNSFVKRNGEGTSTSTGAPPAKSPGALGVSKSKLTSQSVTMQQPQQKKVQLGGPSTSMHSPSMVNDVKNEIPEAGGSNVAIDKEKVAQPLAKKKKVQTDKTSAGNGGALVNMWGRTTTKSKADRISTETNNAIPNSAEAQICAREEVKDGNINEDDEDVNIKRSNGTGNRKRRVVFDYSDEEDEDAVNLASPDPPKTKTSIGLKQNSNTPEVEKTLHFEENEKTDKQLKGESLANMESKKQIALSDTLSHGPSNDATIGVKRTDAAPKSPQRKKVLKTRIDDRGREVTEVVWEGKEEKKPDANLTKKAENKVANDAVDRPPAPKKPIAIRSNAPSNQAAKVGNKKGGNKDPKQGNILSFFKKV